MGEDTMFNGNFKFNKPVEERIVKFVNNLNNSRRMKRSNEAIKAIYPDWKDWCLDGNLGEEGEFFAHATENYGQEQDGSILDYNCPPKNQPGLWMQWVIVEDEFSSDFYLVWDGMEKFYNYVEWLQYLIDNVFAPNGYSISGAVSVCGNYGETIIVSDNNVSVL